MVVNLLPLRRRKRKVSNILMLMTISTLTNYLINLYYLLVEYFFLQSYNKRKTSVLMT